MNSKPTTNTMVTLKVIMNGYKTFPFFSKQIVKEVANVYKVQDAKIYSIDPSITDSVAVLEREKAYIVVYQERNVYRVVDNDGSFIINQETFDFLTLIS
jgi:hypothetical protein